MVTIAFKCLTLNKQMNERLNKLIHSFKWINEQVQTNKWVKEQANEWVKEQTYETLNERVNE